MFILPKGNYSYNNNMYETKISFRFMFAFNRAHIFMIKKFEKDQFLSSCCTENVSIRSHINLFMFIIK